MSTQHVAGSRSGHAVRAAVLPSLALILLSGCASFPGSDKKTSGSSGNIDTPLIGTSEADLPNDAANVSSIEVASLGGAISGITNAPLDLMICKMQVSNPPSAIDRKVSRPSATACLNGVSLLVAPAPEACLTSGFGPRSGRTHKGIDLQSKPAGDVVAAAPGEVIVNQFRKKDYGNWIVIDHGADVYTAYAHLASVNPLISEGDRVAQGQTLGVMGRTGAEWITAVHLHYEVRQGKLLNNNYFGLTPVDPFALPGSCPAS